MYLNWGFKLRIELFQIQSKIKKCNLHNEILTKCICIKCSSFFNGVVIIRSDDEILLLFLHCN